MSDMHVEIDVDTKFEKSYQSYVADWGVGGLRSDPPPPTTLANHGTSTDLCFNYPVRISVPGSNGIESIVAYERVSIASSAFRSERFYRCAGGAPVRATIGTYGTPEQMATALSDQMGSSQTAPIVLPPNVPPPPIKLNTKQATSMAAQAAQVLKAREGVSIRIDGVARHVARAMVLMTMARDIQNSGLPGSGPAVWRSRYPNPTRVACHDRTLNLYLDLAAEIKSGSHINIEIRLGEVYLMPMISLLLGLEPANITFKLGQKAGVSRVPHIMDVSLTPFTYSYTIKDYYGTPPAGSTDPAIAGLIAASWSAQSSPDFVPPTPEALAPALHIIARSLREADQIEASFLTMGIEAFAEQWKSQTVSVGTDLSACGMSGMLSSGEVLVPGGSTASCFGALIAEYSKETVEASGVINLLNATFSSLANIREYVKPCIFALQAGMRSIGASADVVFSNVPWGSLHQAGMPPPCTGTRATLYRNLLLAGETPSRAWRMAELMANVYLDTVLPEALSLYSLGSIEANPKVPGSGDYVLGEALRSIHPSQLPTSSLTAKAGKGLPIMEMNPQVFLNGDNYSLAGMGKAVPNAMSRSDSPDGKAFVGRAGKMLAGQSVQLMLATSLNTAAWTIEQSSTKGVAGVEREARVIGSTNFAALPNRYWFGASKRFDTIQNGSDMAWAVRKLPFLCDYSSACCFDLMIGCTSGRVRALLDDNNALIQDLSYVIASVQGGNRITGFTGIAHVGELPDMGRVAKRGRKE